MRSACGFSLVLHPPPWPEKQLPALNGPALKNDSLPWTVNSYLMDVYLRGGRNLGDRSLRYYLRPDDNFECFARDAHGNGNDA